MIIATFIATIVFSLLQTIDTHRSTEWTKSQALHEICISPHSQKYDKACKNEK